MSVRMIEAVKFLPVTPTQKLVLFVLADCHNEHTGVCNPSCSYIERASGLATRTVWAAIDGLKKAGVLVVQSYGAGRQNSYQLSVETHAADAQDPGGKCTSAANAPVQQMHGTHAANAGDPGGKCIPPMQQMQGTHAADAHKPEVTGIEPEVEPERTGTLSARAASPKFTAPTLQEWQAYAGTLQPAFPDFESERAWNHYVSNGWRVGKNPCKDWKACCRTCHGRWRSESANPHNGRHNGRAGGHADRFHPESKNPTRTLF